MIETIRGLAENQVFAGVAGAAIVSGALFQLRSLPQRIWAIVRSRYSVTVTIHSDQEAFRHVDLWLARHPSAQKSRRLALAEWWDQVENRTEFEMTPGDGPHLLWEGRRPVLVERSSSEGAAPGGGGATPAGGHSGARRQTITITTMGRSRDHVKRILGEAQTVLDRDVVPIYVWRGHSYELIERRRRRALASVILGPGLQEQIVADARRFIERRGWYVDRGIPHRRGYLFEGPPGTGKSSMALALAGELHRSIYIINPSAVYDDNALQAALNQAGAGVVLIEDIDAIEISRERKAEPAVQPASGMFAPQVPTSSGVTASGLLNAIDGVAARDGRILIITSNHPDKLDAALIRPGRVDMRCHFGLAGEGEAQAMFRRFCPDEPAEAFTREIAPDLPLSPAELQNRLLKIAA